MLIVSAVSRLNRKLIHDLVHAISSPDYIAGSTRQSGQRAQLAGSIRRCESRFAAGAAVSAQHGRRSLQSVSATQTTVDRRQTSDDIRHQNRCEAYLVMRILTFNETIS